MKKRKRPEPLITQWTRQDTAHDFLNMKFVIIFLLSVATSFAAEGKSFISNVLWLYDFVDYIFLNLGWILTREAKQKRDNTAKEQESAIKSI